jgi:hypothetical protein
MAYKTFANGFPLPASDLNNFLMNQSVIVFADSAARGTAIPSPVQGMLTYLVDTSSYESWNGSAFVSISNPGDITAVTAGTGLTGGGTSGDVTLNLDTAAVIPSSTVTTAQDLIVADGASSVTRLGVGTDDQVLSVVAGEVAWADAGGGGENWSQLATASLPAAATVSITGFSAKGKYYLAINSASSVNAQSTITVKINGTSANYSTNKLYWSYGSSYNPATFGWDTESSYVQIGRMSASATSTVRGGLIVRGSQGDGQKFYTSFGSGNAAGSNSHIMFYGNGIWNNSAAITSFEISSSSGDFDAGTYTLYGSD